MTNVSVKMDIPSTSQYYSGGGVDTEIILYGVQEITIKSSKKLLNIQVPKDGATQDSEDSDQFDNQVVDLKRGQDAVTIKGWLADDSVQGTAWSQFWKLRAMCARGGPVSELNIDDDKIIFDGQSGRQQAFLEDVQATAKSMDITALNTAGSDGTARMEVLITFLIGVSRY